MSSDKKVKANQQNSQNSTGPTTQEGKARTSRNALKSGLFSRELVIASLGERQEEFDSLLSGLLDSCPPPDGFIGFLVEDVATDLWGIRRVRRYETAEIRKRCDTARYRRRVEKLSEVGSLKMRFALDCATTWTNPARAVEWKTLLVSLDETRKQLERTSLGLDFLLEQVEGLRKIVERDGCLSAQNVEVLLRIWGMDLGFEYIEILNKTAKAEMEELKNDEKADPNRFGETKQVWSALFECKIEALRALKALITNLESAEEEASLAALVMPPPEVLDTINRAETRLRRNLFKSMDTLFKLIYGESPIGGESRCHDWGGKHASEHDWSAH